MKKIDFIRERYKLEGLIPAVLRKALRTADEFVDDDGYDEYDVLRFTIDRTQIDALFHSDGRVVLR